MLKKQKLYIFLMALGAAGCLQSCDNDNDSMAVPSELQSAFSSRYPNASRVEWDWEAGYYVADFYDVYEISAWFSPEGVWQMTETDIPYNALPQAVRTTFESGEYATWRCEDVDKLERTGKDTVYVIEVENGNRELDLHYSESGMLVESINRK